MSGRLNTNNPIPITEAACTARGGTWKSGRRYTERLNQFTNEGACRTNGGTWAVPINTKGQFGQAPTCLRTLPPPVLLQAPTTGVNYNGNARNLETPSANIQIPAVSKRTRAIIRLRQVQHQILYSIKFVSYLLVCLFIYLSYFYLAEDLHENCFM